MTLSFLIQKEFLQIRRNSFMPKIILLFPIMIMCVMPWVMNMEVKNIVVEVVDNDRSTQSQQIVHRIEASRYFVFAGQSESYATALKHIETRGVDVVLVIPPRYGRDLAMGKKPQVLVAANSVNGTKGSIGASYLSQIVTAQVEPSMSALQAKVATLNLYNKHQDYKVYMIPALMGILVMMLCGFLPALNIVGEKERGTIEQINVTPVSKWAFILSKLIPYWIIALIVLSVCFVLSWAVYGITCQGSLWLVYLLAALLALFFSSLGLVISNYSDTMLQAMLVMWFFVVCLMLLSGLFTPTRSMPDWAYLTTYINPMHYFIDAIRTVFVRGGGFADISRQIAMLAGCGSVMAVWAIRSYSKHK
ncbi:MAG: ABC transporter permease [Alloprevotella sp.]|nr:ABC transporter permease [Alloprevotella sp.]